MTPSISGRRRTVPVPPEPLTEIPEYILTNAEQLGLAMANDDAAIIPYRDPTGEVVFVLGAINRTDGTYLPFARMFADSEEVDGLTAPSLPPVHNPQRRPLPQTLAIPSEGGLTPDQHLARWRQLAAEVEERRKNLP